MKGSTRIVNIRRVLKVFLCKVTVYAVEKLVDRRSKRNKALKSSITGLRPKATPYPSQVN